MPDLVALAEGLPRPWVALWDGTSRRVFYAHATTGETTFLRPQLRPLASPAETTARARGLSASIPEGGDAGEGGRPSPEERGRAWEGTGGRGRAREGAQGKNMEEENRMKKQKTEESENRGGRT